MLFSLIEPAWQNSVNWPDSALELKSFTAQSPSIPDNNLTKDEQQALKWLKNDSNIVTLPADNGRVTVMDKTDYFDKMDALGNDKKTYEERKRDYTWEERHIYKRQTR